MAYSSAFLCKTHVTAVSKTRKLSQYTWNCTCAPLGYVYG